MKIYRILSLSDRGRMNKTLKDFYEEYWEYRKSVGKIHTNQGAWIPDRLITAISMIGNQIGNHENKINILDIGCGEGTLGMLLKKNL